MTNGMSSAFLADLIVLVHVIWVAIVVLTVPLVGIGAWRGWIWVRNPWFRHVHLLMIGIVVFESVFGITCPLTDWENAARVSAGGDGYSRSFVGHWLHELLYFDLEPWVFTAAYVAFGVLVVALYVLVPPRRRA